MKGMGIRHIDGNGNGNGIQRSVSKADLAGDVM